MDDSSHSRISEWDELEARSLMSAVKNGAHDTLPNPRAKSKFLKRQIQMILFLALCAFVTIFKEDILSLILLEKEEQGGVTGIKIPIEELRTLFLDGKKDFDEMVKKDYGEYAEQVFDTVSVMKYFKSPYDVPKFEQKIDKSRERLKRRMKIKIIESQISKGTTTFTWVVGGHSAAAGHGNLFRQASANVIEQSLKGAFAALGITFRAKNYAMGGTSSGPEVAMCMESIFGKDVDILSWDYGMTDGRNPGLYNLWTQRAGVHPTRPILFSFGQRYSDDIHNNYVNAGGAGFESNYANVRAIFPSSDVPDVDASQLPPGVKNYLCNNGHAETGEPCGDNLVKFDTNHTCPYIGHQVKWHNGWKDHLLIGRIAAAFILENFLEALDDLSKQEVNDEEGGEGVKGEGDDTSADLSSSLNDLDSVVPNTKPEISSRYLTELRMFENKDRAAFFASDPPKGIFDGETDPAGFNFTFLKRSRSLCRTALLPSQARYDGLLGTNASANYVYGGKTDYVDEGYDFYKPPKGQKDDNSTELPLVYNHLKNRNLCKEAEIDFKDLFYVRDEDDWMATTIPNDKEKTYFENSGLEGIIMMCTLVFDWERYPADYVKITDFFNYTIATQGGILVNGIKAKNVTPVNKNCFVLKHEDGDKGHLFPVGEEGKVELQIKVPRSGGNLYLTSIVSL